MPRVNLYVRVEDWDKYQAIESKAEWLHEHLNGSFINQDFIIGETQRAQEESKKREELAGFESLGLIVDDSVETVEVNKIFKSNFGGTQKVQVCEHFQPKGQCLVKGCKYGKA